MLAQTTDFSLMDDAQRRPSTPRASGVAALVHRAREGDTHARNELVRRHYRLVHGVLLGPPTGLGG